MKKSFSSGWGQGELLTVMEFGAAVWGLGSLGRVGVGQVPLGGLSQALGFYSDF